MTQEEFNRHDNNTDANPHANRWVRYLDRRT